eukprot:71667-Chlamydomonas_euryale.AAC.1
MFKFRVAGDPREWWAVLISTGPTAKSGALRVQLPTVTDVMGLACMYQGATKVSRLWEVLQYTCPDLGPML